jgi:sensor histidine kinase YesM
MPQPQSRPRWLFLLLWINGSVTMVALLLYLADRSAPGGFWPIWGYSLLSANVTGVPAIALLPALIDAVARRRWPLIPAATLGILAFAAWGCLVVQALLIRMGVFVSRNFWNDYLHTLSLAALVSLALGLGAFLYGSMRDRLQVAEERLIEQELSAERVQKLAAEARLRSLETRIHPHFLFNTLNSISSLIATDPARAEEIVGRLAALLRSSLDTISQPLIPLRQELAMVEDYLEIEKARFGDRLQATLDIPEHLRDAQVPPLAVQSLVENAVKHGIAPQRSGGTLRVTAGAESGQLRIRVSDTGPGFDLTAIRPAHGLDNLVGRLDALFGSRARLAVFRQESRCVAEIVLPRS